LARHAGQLSDRHQQHGCFRLALLLLPLSLQSPPAVSRQVKQPSLSVNTAKDVASRTFNACCLGALLSAGAYHMLGLWSVVCRVGLTLLRVAKAAKTLCTVVLQSADVLGY
jgi:hypothetical protein